jgi:hypothetical protein
MLRWSARTFPCRGDRMVNGPGRAVVEPSWQMARKPEAVAFAAITPDKSGIFGQQFSRVAGVMRRSGNARCCSRMAFVALEACKDHLL